MAISADGFIAKKDGDSDWVSEVDTLNFEKTIKDAGCLIVGRKTFEQYEGELYPMKDVYNVVLTNNKEKNKETNGVLISSKPPMEVLKLLNQKGFKSAVVIGGGTLNTSFLKERLIDEIYLSVHPLILGNGIKLFENTQDFVNLKLEGVEKLEDNLVQLHYKVIK
jgi:dihydrofolate reductase